MAPFGSLSGFNSAFSKKIVNFFLSPKKGYKSYEVSAISSLTRFSSSVVKHQSLDLGSRVQVLMGEFFSTHFELEGFLSTILSSLMIFSYRLHVKAVEICIFSF